MADVDQSSRREVLSYLRKQSSERLPSWVLRADVEDAQALVIRGCWEYWRRERFWLRAALARGHFPEGLREPLGLGRGARSEGGNPRQSVPDRLASLDALLRYDGPERELDRAARRQGVAAGRRGDEVRWGWVEEHRGELREVIAGVLAAAHRYGVGGARWMAELAADADEDVVTPATLMVLGLAVGELRTQRAVVELTTPHGVHRWLRRADLLRAAFAGVGQGAHWIHTPPRPVDTDGSRFDPVPIMAEVIARRGDARVDDPHRWRLPDPDQGDPAEVLDYLQRYSDPRVVPGWVRYHDALAALRLHVGLWWLQRDDERFWLRAGVRRGLFLSLLGAPWGISTRKGVLDRLDRLEQLLATGRPDEKLARQRRAVEAQIAASRDHGSAITRWIEAHRGELDAVIAGLLAAAERWGLVEDERLMLDELAVDYRRQEYSVGTMSLLGLAVDELSDATIGDQGREAADSSADALRAQVEALRASFGEVSGAVL